MASEIRQTAEDIFHAACTLPAEDRPAFLERVCGGDLHLREEVEELLRHDSETEGFLAIPPAMGAGRQMAERALARETQPDSLRSELLAAEPDEQGMIGPYRIIEKLGQGAMGVVYLGEEASGRRVAIKVLPKDIHLDRDRLARFDREARMLEELRSLKHPNIAEIFNQVDIDGRPCIILEYVPGRTLAEVLDAGPLALPEALRLALQIADGLKAAHLKRIIHRDLKPANIKITPEGQVKILDFGLAKHFHPELSEGSAAGRPTRSMSLTDSGIVLGTPAYMSPEQWNGGALDHRADLWAFGCLLYEMLTGKHPFARATRAETMKAVLHDPPDWQALPAETPLRIQNLLRQCLRKEVGARLGDPAEAFHEIAGSMHLEGSTLSLLLRSWTWKLNKRMVAAFSAGAVILVLLGIGRYTPLFDPLLRPKKEMTIRLTRESDLASILRDNLKGTDAGLIRAPLYPGKHASQELLDTEEWRRVKDNRENSAVLAAVIEALKSRIASEPGSAQLQAILAQAHLFRFYLSGEAGEKDRAAEAARQAQRLLRETGSSDQLAVDLAVGNVLLALEKHQEAIDIFEKARARHPDDPDLLLGLAMARDSAGDEAGEVEKIYQSAIDARRKKQPGAEWEEQNELGWFYYDDGRYDRAADCWREVVRLNPLSPTGYLNLGNALFQQGCFTAAVTQYQQSIATGGETVEARTSLGAVHFFLGNFRESIAELEQVTGGGEAGRTASRLTAWGNLGDSYAAAGRQTDAAAAYRVALELIDGFLRQFPNDYEKTAYRAEIVARLAALEPAGGWEDPRPAIDRIVAAQPDCLSCLGSAVIVYHLRRQDDQAARLASQAVAQGLSPVYLAANPELISLRRRKQFVPIVAEAAKRQSNCR